MINFRLLFIVPLFILFLCGRAISEEKNSTISAIAIKSPITLDGLLNEDSWRGAVPVSDFTQRELIEGAPPTEKTEVRLLYDAKNIYFGIICYDSEPDKIVHKELKWDGDLTADDCFGLVLDTFNDQRTGYVFGVNPNGARADGLIKNNITVNTDWNGVWDVAARITESGWSAEIVIPFRTLQFSNDEVQDWGINFKRLIRHKNEELLWTAWNRNDGLYQLSKAGKLVGLNNVKRGKQTEVIPYMLSGVQKERGKNGDDTFKYGAEVKYPVTSDLTLNLSAKTDFAQVESDKEVINLTRFNLQYPEKRDFFLEGAEIFDFTQGGTKMYYSRRIGITPDPDRQEVPIMGGMKLSGKSGSYRIGVMSMQTEQTTVRTANGSKNVYPSTNYTVVRVKKDVLKQSYIGFIGTSVYRADTPHNPLTGIDDKDRFFNKRKNQMAAFDFAYNTSTFMKNKNFSVQGYFAASKSPGLKGDGYAGRVYVEYANDLVDSFLLYHGIDNNFNPEIGFVSRPGISQCMAMLQYMPRVNIPFVKKFLFEPYEFSYMTNTHNRLLSRRLLTRPFGIQFESDDVLEFNVHNEYDYVDYDFNVFGNTKILKGTYDYWYYEINYESVKSRPVAVDLSTIRGNYYLGKRTSYSVSSTFKLSKHFALTPDFTYYDISMGNDSFTARQTSARFVTNISTRLTSSTFVQWNNQSHEVNMNFRIHYIPRIGSDIYLAYNQLWDEENEFITLRNTGILKVNYLFRF